MKQRLEKLLKSGEEIVVSHIDGTRSGTVTSVGDDCFDIKLENGHWILIPFSAVKEIGPQVLKGGNLTR
jgi:preprotein translocase subunit YajC